MRHELKTWPEFFEAVREQRKLFEIRRNDRLFNVGDLLFLKEWDPEHQCYTGREVSAMIDFILNEHDGLKDGFIIMSLTHIATHRNQKREVESK